MRWLRVSTSSTSWLEVVPMTLLWNRYMLLMGSCQEISLRKLSMPKYYVYYNYNLNNKTDKIHHNLMDITRNNRQLSAKETIIKHTTAADSKTNLAADQLKKKKSKNITIEVNKNQADFISRQQREKSKDKDRRKNNQASFNDVVLKFKKLFDEKIKFVRDDPDPVTERLDNKQKKSYGGFDLTEAKMKKVESSANLENKKNTRKQGFSELISDIEAKLNMHRNNKQKSKHNQTQRQFISIDENQPNPLKNLYKPRIKPSKSKEKTNNKSKSKSKQKYGSTSRTLSAIKKTERVNAFQSLDQDAELEKQTKGKSKNKMNRIQSTKTGKKVEVGNAIDDRTAGNLSIREKNSAKYRSGNLSQGKYKNRIKTFESENINQRDMFKAQKPKSKKQGDKSKKQSMKTKTKEQKVKKLDKQKNTKSRNNLQQKSSKTGLLDKSRQKKKVGQNVLDSKQSGMAKKKKNNNLVLTVGTKMNKRNNELTSQFLFANNLHSRVSSSPDEKEQSDQYSSEQEDSSMQQESIEGSENEKVSENKQNPNVLGSVIMYDVGQEGDLNFSRQIANFNQQNQQSNFSSAYQSKNFSAQLIAQYVRGFTQYVQFFYKKRLLEQFQSPIKFDSQQLQNNKKTGSIQDRPVLEENKEKQQKMYIKIEHALKQEQMKWLNFKKNLERIRKCENFSEEIEKIILQAEENHLALKSMEIKDTTHSVANQNLMSASQKQKDSFFEKQLDEANGDKSQRLFKDGSITKKYMEQNSQSESEFGATVKTPIRNQGNQINININISDAEIKIQSPHKNFAMKKPDRSEEILAQNQHKMQIVIRKDDPNPRISSKIEKSLTDSEISLRNLMDQCCNQFPKNIPEIDVKPQPIKQTVQKPQSKLETMQSKKEEIQENENVVKQLQQKTDKPKEKKRKLSYEEAPLQIKKILHAPKTSEQKQIKVEEKKKLLLQSDLDLSEFMSSRAMDHSLDNSSASNKNDKRIKIFEEIKSPSSYRQMHQLSKDNRIENGNKELRQEKEQTKNRIKISLFNSNSSDKSNSGSGREYRSQGNLELVHSQNKLLTKSGNKNFILLKPKRVSQISSPDPSQSLSKATITEKPEQEEKSPKKQTHLSSESWLIQDQQTYNYAKPEIKNQGNESLRNNLDPHINQQAIQEQSEYIVPQEINCDSNKVTYPEQPIFYNFNQFNITENEQGGANIMGKDSTQKEEEQEQQQEQEVSNMFRKSSPPQVKISSYEQSGMLIVDELIGQFITDLIQVDELDRPQLGQNGQWVFNKIGQTLITHFNSQNIQIEQQGNSEDLLGSPYQEIRQYQSQSQPNNSMAARDQQPCTDEDGFNRKVQVDTSYIIQLVSGLFDFLQSHSQQYSQFTSRIKKPLGVDTLHLLKVLRDNQIGPVGFRDGEPGLEGELDQFFEGDDHFLEEDNEDYYIISLESLAMFQNETFTEQSNTNQQFFNQAIYDKVNMILDNLRPYGTRGLPVLNFMHKHKIRDPATGVVTFQISGCSNPKLNQHRSFGEIKYYLLEELVNTLKIRLGLFSYDVESDKITQYSLEKLVSEYALEMDQQWKTLNDGDFQVKHSVMLALQDWILLEEIETIWEIMTMRKQMYKSS